MPGLLNGRVAIITGAGRGIGRAHALEMARQGAKVVVNDLGTGRDGAGNSQGPAGEIVAEIKKMGGQAVANYGSVTDPEQANAIIKTAVDTFGRVDIMVNNAGILRDRIVFNMSDEEWDLVLKVHLYGTFYCTRAACRIMKEQGYGRIINTSSIAGMGQLGQVNYSAAKEGIVGLTRTVARDMARFNVTCNAIRPVAATRLTVTDELYEMRRKSMGEEKAMQWRKAIEAASPEDITPVVVFLASEQAANVTGCVFDVRSDFVARYEDPPRLCKTIVKTGGKWSVEELIEVMPKTLTAGLGEPLPAVAVKQLTCDAKGWEFDGKKLTEAATPPVK
ncbi:MAG: SDR family oxidoreductase [Chloroflexi bacterium]|nr:SDR family oxidoreductase [Chloroflexota bacterium]